MIEIFHFLKISKFINDLGKIFSIGENEMNHWKFCSYHRMFGQKTLKIFLAYVYKSIELVNELKRMKY